MIHITRRSALRGTIYILIASLIIGLTISQIKLINKNKELELNIQNYSDIIDVQVEEKTKLEKEIQKYKKEIYELNDKISTLEEENSQIEEKNVELEKENENLKKKTSTSSTTQKSGFGSFKSYTDYHCLSRSSAQWKLQEQAYTDDNGLRKIGDCYLVAMGSYYGTTLGTKYTVTLSNGNCFQVMLCDCKQDRHTDSNNQTCLANGSVLEFYVDSSLLPNSVRVSGSVGSIEYFSGSIVSIT